MRKHGLMIILATVCLLWSASPASAWTSYCTEQSGDRNSSNYVPTNSGVVTILNKCSSNLDDYIDMRRVYKDALDWMRKCRANPSYQVTCAMLGYSGKIQECDNGVGNYFYNPNQCAWENCPTINGVKTVPAGSEDVDLNDEVEENFIVDSYWVQYPRITPH